MSVNSELERIRTGVADAYSAVESKGGTLPASQTISNLSTAILDLPSGGVTSYNDLTDKLVAGDNITISEDNVISATDTTYTAGDNITIENGVISATGGEDTDTHGISEVVFGGGPAFADYQVKTKEELIEAMKILRTTNKSIVIANTSWTAISLTKEDISAIGYTDLYKYYKKIDSKGSSTNYYLSNGIYLPGSGTYATGVIIFKLAGWDAWAIGQSGDIRFYLSKMFFYDNTKSGLTNTTIQGAIDELATRPEGVTSYNDLTDKPTIPEVPTNVSDFTNDAGYLTEHQTLKTINNIEITGDGNIEIPQGPQGPAGDSYTITEADYTAIANIVIATIGNAEGGAY